MRGSAAQLERFHAEVGQEWRGGEFLRRLSSKTEYRYWAYPTRTAPEARKFMFSTFEQGLRMDIEEFDQATYYPKERLVLDGIVSTCEVKDPFEIRPNRTLVVQLEPGVTPEDVDCILTQLKNADFGDEMPIGFVGNKAWSERG